MSGMSAPMDGGAGAISSSCCFSSSCPKVCVAGISTGVITSAKATIPSIDSLLFIACLQYLNLKKGFFQILSKSCPNQESKFQFAVRNLPTVYFRLLSIIIIIIIITHTWLSK